MYVVYATKTIIVIIAACLTLYLARGKLFNGRIMKVDLTKPVHFKTREIECKEPSKPPRDITKFETSADELDLEF